MFDWLGNVIESVMEYCGSVGSIGYIIIVLLIAVENIFPPIPSEVILGFGGALTAAGKMAPWAVVLSATIGSFGGALILYFVGRFFSPERLEKWLNGKVGRLLGFKPGDVSKAVKWFEKRGELSVLICRCVPIVRSLISIPAGISRMPLPKFMIFTAVGSAVWNTILVYCGWLLGDNWRIMLDKLEIYKWVVLAILIVVFIIVLIFFIKKKKAQKGA